MSDSTLPTVNDLSLAIAQTENIINRITEDLSVRFGISVELFSKEDELKLGLYHTQLKITKINGVKLG